jgi:hypothetical protein
MDAINRAKNARKWQQKNKRKKVAELSFKSVMINEGVRQLLESKRANQGKVQYGEYDKIMKQLESHNITGIDRHKLHYAVTKQEKELRERMPLSEIHTNNTENTGEDLSSLGIRGVEDAPPLQKKAGRPFGTTNDFLRNRDENDNNCITECAKRFQKIRDDAKVNGKRAPRGALQKIIDETKKEMRCNIYISNDTVRSRFKRGSLEPPHPGNISPLEPAEEALVQFLLKMGNMRQPLTPMETVEFMNEIIENHELQQELVNFKRARCPHSDPETLGEVKRDWFERFMGRNRHRLVTKRGELFVNSRADWSRIEYIAQMYDVIYDAFVEAGIASKLDEKVYMDRQRNIVTEDLKYGEKIDIDLHYPEMLFFADEAGLNTSQKKDGNQSGQKFVTGRGQTPKIICSSTDHRFTILPLTAGNGDAVMMVVIFQKGNDEGVPANWHSGIDIFVEPILDENEDPDIFNENNYGKDKYFPDGPSCHFRGKVVPCATYVSESGGITAEILVDVLATMDRLKLVVRVDGKYPVLVIDGHETRLNPKFLEYINGEGHMWFVLLGVPYATSYWQVGDSSEQNGCAKTLWYKEKDKLVKFKIRKGMPISIKPTDIMPLLNRVLPRAYGRKDKNLNACADRGWNPPNRKLLSHPDFAKTSNNQEPSSSASTSTRSSNLDPTTLNFEGEVGSNIVETIMQHQQRSGGLEKRQKSLRDGQKAVDNLVKATKLTAGALVSNGIHNVGCNKMMEAVSIRKRKREKKQKEAARKARNELRGKIERVVSARAKHGNEKEKGFDKWNPNDLKAYLQYKKIPSDKAMPKHVGELRARCSRVMGRESPTASPDASDDEDDDEGEGLGVGVGVLDLDGLNVGLELSEEL